ncbi:hypothetical protein J1TS5_34680 [Paenibacillus macerans]|nr:hypothetical protein J1TS5_34680 [Paenibacillus macerans]
MLVPRAKFEKNLKRVVTPNPNTDNVLTSNSIKSNISDVFIWPSTDAVESIGGKKTHSHFETTSELYQLGYKITGNTRSMRRSVLDHEAVPKLGLEKTAKTIASLVRMRKRQKDGKEIYQHAIAEREEDLAYLKEKYYKGSFHWPSTT